MTLNRRVMDFVDGHEICARRDTRRSFKGEAVIINGWKTEKLWKKVCEASGRLFPYPGDIMDEENKTDSDIFRYTMALLDGDIPKLSLADIDSDVGPEKGSICFISPYERRRVRGRGVNFTETYKHGALGLFLHTLDERWVDGGYKNIVQEKYNSWDDHEVVGHFVRSMYDYEDHCRHGPVGHTSSFSRENIMFLQNNQSPGDKIHAGDIVIVKDNRIPIFEKDLEFETDDVYDEYGDVTYRAARSSGHIRHGSLERKVGHETMDQLEIGAQYPVVEVEGGIVYLGIADDKPQVIGMGKSKLQKAAIAPVDTRPDDDVRHLMQKAVVEFYEHFGIIRKMSALRQMIVSYHRQGIVNTSPKGLVKSIDVSYEEALACCEVMKYANE